ncbi:SseB family protein [Streptococcus didelphis]|uniref:SseB family protein n=1 Tax=Streptococcus didelphis TaxID=102886 RepID=A0ABY9LGC6_9STRE|nr:SseB family protein [Streptococcus didelphis]WMB27914.1 SseB family protein [Streptococcus didelphis]
MTKQTSNELDIRLRAFINAPDNFLDSVALVDAFHHFPVWAAKEPYAIEIEGVKVTPVFTDKDDMAAFKWEQKSAQSLYWLERSAISVLEEVIKSGLSGLVFNLKKDGDFGNSTIFKSSDMIQFINNYTSILNSLMNDENQAAQTMDKIYLVPAFIQVKSEKYYDRFFPTMSTPEGKSYVPAFSNLESFAKWYNQEDFGGAFRRGQGVILTWKIADIYQPRNGENEIEETFGVAINPFDEDQILMDWTEIKK